MTHKTANVINILIVTDHTLHSTCIGEWLLLAYGRGLGVVSTLILTLFPGVSLKTSNLSRDEQRGCYCFVFVFSIYC